MDDALRVRATAAPVRAQVARVLQEAIVSGRFAPGDRLIERELCDLTGVSRTSVREALRQLESEGLVRMVPNRGPIVAVVTLEEARDLYEVRAALEGLAGELFAARATDEQVAALRASVDRMKAAVRDDSNANLAVEKDRFYELLLEGAGNDVVASMLNSLHTRITMLRRTTLAQPGRSAQVIKELDAILDAVEAREPVASGKACAQHVRSAANVALEVLSQGSDGPDASAKATEGDVSSAL